MNISAASFSSYGGYGASASPAVAAASVVTNTGQGLVIETTGKLKISEIDGKNVTSMYGSGPGEGEVLNRVKLGGTNNNPPPAQSINSDPAQVARPVLAPAPQPVQTTSAGVPTAATFAYQAVSGFGGSGSAAASSTFSIDS